MCERYVMPLPACVACGVGIAALILVAILSAAWPPPSGPPTAIRINPRGRVPVYPRRPRPTL